MDFKDFLKELKGRMGKEAASMAQVQRFTDHFIALIRDIVLDEGRVSVPGLGIFHLSERGPRMVKNPNFTGAIAARKIVRFKPSRSLKQEALTLPVSENAA
jgi:nucleoid DNA-binding protein